MNDPAERRGKGASAPSPPTQAETGAFIDPIGVTELSPFASGDVSRVSPRADSGLLPLDPLPLPIVDPSRYEMLEEVGRGGLGRVLRAYDRQLKRIVAVKERLDGRGTLERFVHEAIATAGLEHPGIISVHDAGRWPSGEPFYAMRFVAGRSLADVIAELPTLAQRLALLPNVIAVADAVAYAHSKGLVHRDLKPANVLVGAFGETVVIDWGIAKTLGTATRGDAPAEPISPRAAELTVAGTVLGTPAYMPPEQAAGGDVDERADVYALGALLYEVLAGKPPHDTTTPDVLARVLVGDWIPLGDRQAGVAPELRTIAARAMARDPRDRYPSAKELADDLRRFQTGQLVQSHEYSPWALLRRWLYKHRLVVAFSGVLIATLSVMGGVSVRRIVRARAVAELAQRDAEAAAQIAEARTDALLLAEARALLEVDPTGAIAVLETYPRDGGDWDGVSALASDAWSRGLARRVLTAEGELENVVFAPDGRWIAAGGADEHVHLWDTETGASRTFTTKDRSVLHLAASPDARWIVAAGPLDGGISVWDVATGAARTLVGHEAAIRWLGFSRTGVLASSSRDKTLRVWDVATGEGRVLLRFGAVRDCGRVALSADGRWLAYGGLKSVHLLDVTSGTERPLPEHEAGTGALAFSEDGRTLVSGGMDGKVRVWDVPTGVVRVLAGAHRTWISSMALSPDGKRLATIAGEGVGWLWDLPSGERRALPSAFEVSSVVFSPDGSALAVGGDDRLVHIWDTASLTTRVLRGHGAPISRVAFSPDGRSLASSSLDRTARVWDLRAGGLRALGFGEGTTTGFKFSSDGRMVALQRDGEREQVAIADVRSGRMRALGTGDGPFPSTAATTTDGAPLGPEQSGLRAYIEDGASCGLGQRLKDVYRCAYSRDGSLVATGGFDKTVRVYRMADKTLRTLGEHDSTVLAIAISADGRTIASGGSDHTVRVWDAATGAARVFRGHEADVESLAFLSDGARLGSVSIDGSLRLWDLATGEARVLGTDPVAARSLAFTPDDRFALVGDRSGSIRMWELASGRSRVIRRHAALVKSIGVSPDGATVISNGADGSTWLWDLDAVPAFSSDPGELLRWMRGVTTAETR